MDEVWISTCRLQSFILSQKLIKEIVWNKELLDIIKLWKDIGIITVKVMQCQWQ